MKKFSLTALARRHLETATGIPSGRIANTVYGGHEHVLRRTVIALAGGQRLGERTNPGEARIFVLTGRVRLSTGAHHWDGREGDLLIVPRAPHSLVALEDTAILLTVAKTDENYLMTGESGEATVDTPANAGQAEGARA